jgi:hypothetical protein
MKKFEGIKFLDFYTITVEIEDFLMVKDALCKAINFFNTEGEAEFKLVNTTDKYCLRIAKKSGKPNYDLPQICLKNIIYETKIEKLAVVIEDIHLMNPCKEGSFVSHIHRNIAINDTKLSERKETEEYLLDLRKEKKRKCCEICCFI